MDSAKLFFRENPFPASPSPDRYLAIGSVEVARKRLMDAIDRRECPGMLVGPPGTGKSLLCTLIAGAYRNEFDVVLLAESRLCTRKALLQHLLHHLGLPYSEKTEGELRLSLIDRAASGGPASRAGLLIVVDEAHTLPGRLLEELRMMSGIVRNGVPRVQLVLAGGPSLDERFAHPRMEAFSQRISTRCYLHPLGQNETSEYVRGAIRHAGADPQATIDEEALAAVYYAADGIPRLINQTMSRAVALAESESQRRITAEIVQRAWADLQQLPSPIIGGAVAQRSGSAEGDFAVVEFGTLDDERESDPMAETVDYEVGAGVTATPHAGAAQRSAAEGTEATLPEGEVEESGFASWGSPEVEPVRWQVSDESVAEEEAVPNAAALKAAALEAAALEAAALEAAALEAAALEAAVLETAALEASDWEPSVVDFGGWEAAAVETAGWEADVVAAGDEAAKDVAAGVEAAEDEAAGDEAAESQLAHWSAFEEEAGEKPKATAAVEEATATDVLALFGGAFDEEESLPLNVALPLNLTAAEAGVERSWELAQPALRNEPEAAETQLHREIVSINAEAVRNQPHPNFGELPLGNDILVADDSDLLVIEDDIDVDSRLDSLPPRQRQGAGRARAGQAGAEVDFQSLFSRMREG